MEKLVRLPILPFDLVLTFEAFSGIAFAVDFVDSFFDFDNEGSMLSLPNREVKAFISCSSFSTLKKHENSHTHKKKETKEKNRVPRKID